MNRTPLTQFIQFVAENKSQLENKPLPEILNNFIQSCHTEHSSGALTKELESLNSKKDSDPSKQK